MVRTCCHGLEQLLYELLFHRLTPKRVRAMVFPGGVVALPALGHCSMGGACSGCCCLPVFPLGSLARRCGRSSTARRRVHVTETCRQLSLRGYASTTSARRRRRKKKRNKGQAVPLHADGGFRNHLNVSEISSPKINLLGDSRFVIHFLSNEGYLKVKP